MLIPAIVAPNSRGPLSLFGSPVTHTALTISQLNATAYLDVYAPSGPAPLIPGSRPAMLIVPGVGDNRNDPQLLNLARSLARSGCIVMLATTPTLIGFQLDPADEPAIVAAFIRLRGWPGVNPAAVGILSISAAAALTSAAAADTIIRDQIAYWISFGGHYDVLDVLRVIGARTLPSGDNASTWHPDPVPLEVLANTVAPYLSVTDANLITSAFNVQDTNLTADQIAHLSPAGQAVYHLIAGDEPDQVEAAIAALPSVIQTLLAQLSPRRYVPDIHAPIYLLHDRNDQFVPVTETRHFAASPACRQQSCAVAEFGIFQHAEVRQGQGPLALASDGSKLFRILLAILTYGA